MSQGVYFRQVDKNEIYMMDPSNKVARIIFRDGRTVDELQPDWARAFSTAWTRGVLLSPSEVKAIRVGAGVAKEKPTFTTDSAPIGTWTDPDGYSFVVTKDAVDIYKPSGSKWRTVRRGDGKYSEIVSNLAKDYKAGKLTKRETPLKAPREEKPLEAVSYVPQPVYAPAAPPTGLAALTNQWWFWPSVAGTTLLAGTLLVLFAGRKRQN